MTLRCWLYYLFCFGRTLICLRLQKDRFLKTGWEHVDALDMMTVYTMLPQDDVAR